MAYFNTDKDELIAYSLRSQFTLNQDVVNTEMVDIVNSEDRQF